MSSTNAVIWNYAYELDHSMPAAHHAKLGTVLTNWAGLLSAGVVDDAAQIATLGQVLADLTALRTKFVAMLTKLDTANLAGMSNNNVSTLSPAALTTVAPAQTSVAPILLGG